MSQNSAKKQRVPNSERRQNSIRQVLDAALELFVTKGFDGTSMDDIATQASLTKGALYFYFKDKLSLLDELLVRTEKELIDPIVESIRSKSSTPTMRIVRLTSEFARIGAERKELVLLHVVVSLEMHGRDNKVEQRVRKIYSRLHQEISDVLIEGKASGEFASTLSPKYQASVIIALIDGLLLEWHRRGEELDGEQLARSARQLILSGICMEHKHD
ncbi:MAG: TetR/AcrR family transcriptional regulator [Gammaproteobacteria bacterium]